jgi:hypothetical protein
MGSQSDEKQPIWTALEPETTHILGPQPPIVNPSLDENDVDFKQLAQNFVKKSNRILLKRDQTTTNHPCPDDLAIGEIVLNAVTGNLYTKLVTGRIVMYKPSPVCDLNQVSMDFSASLMIPETCEDICSVSGHGISFTSKARNSLRFNPVLPNEGLPKAFNISYISSETEMVIARISAISDYKPSMSFELLYHPNPESTNFLPLSAKFESGLYPNGNLGSIKVEIL